jgi:hypothetical protein
MPTVWIHRTRAADILVDFEGIIDAYEFAVKLINHVNCYDYMVENTLYDVMNYINLPPEGINILQSDNMQIAIIPLYVTPEPHWNTSGFVKVEPNEAFLLGSDKDPEGFIPYESERVWTKETRSKEELDAELEEYMQNWVGLTTAAAELSVGN